MERTQDGIPTKMENDHINMHKFQTCADLVANVSSFFQSNHFTGLNFSFQYLFSFQLQAVAPVYGFRVAALRFFTVYGPRQRPDLAIHAFARKMVEARTLTLFGDGSQARDYTYCDDIVAGVLAALRWTEDAPLGVEIFNLGGNRAVPTGTMVDELSMALGITPKIERAPMQPGDVQRTAADLTKSGAVLGYAPRTPFREGIRRFVAWFREAYGRAD
jgi:UDP-glucuronate 4-epimerase